MFFLPTLYDSKQPVIGPRPQQLQPKQPVVSWCGACCFGQLGVGTLVFYIQMMCIKWSTLVSYLVIWKKQKKQKKPQLYRFTRWFVHLLSNALKPAWLCESARIKSSTKWCVTLFVLNVIHHLTVISCVTYQQTNAPCQRHSLCQTCLIA